MITLLLVVVVHELGHLIGGLATHYRLTAIEVLGLVFSLNGRNLQIKVDRSGIKGQCLMYPEELSQDPILLIAGGCVANFIAGLAFLLAGIPKHNFLLTIICIWLGGANLIVGLANILSESPTSDGGTLRDVRAGSDRAEIYNKLMVVYWYIETGKGYIGIPDEILEAPPLYDSTLAAELAVYRYYKMRNLAEQNAVYSDCAKELLIDLARFRPETGITEAIHGI